MNDEEFDAKLVCLNALYGSRLHGAKRWEYVEARKEHIDEFGDSIQKGDLYLRRYREGFAYDVFKISRRSMETVLEMLFLNNESFLAYAAELRGKIEERDDKEMVDAFKLLDKPPMKPTGKPKSKPIKNPTGKKRPRPEGFKVIK